MPSISSSSVRAARERLGDQLRMMRENAGLSGVEFARRAEWREASRVSQIEKGRRPVSPSHVRLWCRVCGASKQREAELLAEQRAVASMWTTYKQLHHAGLRLAQESVRDRYERLAFLRGYQTRGMPGLLQTAAYTRAALTTVRAEEGITVDDVDAAVAERMDRQQVLRQVRKRFAYVVEEDTLWYRPYPRDVHADQLRHLLEVTRLPAVTFGVIPRTADRHGVRPRESFIITDDDLVSIEMVSGYMRISTPDEVALYVRAWKGLHSLAVHGDPAAALIRRALDDLTGTG